MENGWYSMKPDSHPSLLSLVAAYNNWLIPRDGIFSLNLNTEVDHIQ